MKSEKLSILSILIFALCIGLLAGAGAGTDHILPVTLITAAVLIASRDKISASSSIVRKELSVEDLQLNHRLGNYYTWPELNQFQYEVRSNSYQGVINRLLQENASNLAKISIDTPLILNAHLIPDSDHLYDRNAIRIDIHDRSIGYLAPEEAPIMHERLNSLDLPNQVTMCKALIYKKSEKTGKNNIYGVRLDIEPFHVPEKHDMKSE